MSDQTESTTKRVSLTPTAYEKLRNFSRGLDASYTETVEMLLSKVVQPDEDPLIAGRRVREELSKDGKRKANKK